MSCKSLIGDKLEENEPQLAGFEHAARTSAATASAAPTLVVKFEVERSPAAGTAPAHAEQGLGKVDLDMASRVAA
jgi:hypothetical protein